MYIAFFKELKFTGVLEHNSGAAWRSLVSIHNKHLREIGFPKMFKNQGQMKMLGWTVAKETFDEYKQRTNNGKNHSG